MPQIPNIAIRKHDTFGLAFLDFDCEYKCMDHILLGLIPEGGSAVILLLDLGDQSSRYTRGYMSNHAIPYTTFQVRVGVCFGVKRQYGFLRLNINYEEQDRYSQIELAASGARCFSFIFERNIAPESKVPKDIFGESGWMSYGERWLSWVRNAFENTGCKYLFLPDSECPELTIVTRLSELDALREKLEARFTKLGYE